MSVFDDPNEELQWMGDEIWDGEEYEEEPQKRGLFRRRAASRAEAASEQQAVYVEKRRRKKENLGLKFLAFLEFLGIMAILWWWIKWLY